MKVKKYYQQSQIKKMKKANLFILLVLNLNLISNGQCLKIKSLTNNTNTLYIGLVNLIQIDYDTVRYKIDTLYSDFEELKYYNKNSNMYSIQCNSIGVAEVNIRLLDKNDSSFYYYCQSFSVKKLSPPVLIFDNYIPSDAISLTQINNLQEFVLKFDINITFHSSVHSFKAFVISNDTISNVFYYSKDINEFKKWLIREYNHQGTLLLFDIDIFVEGVELRINPVQFILI